MTRKTKYFVSNVLNYCKKHHDGSVEIMPSSLSHYDYGEFHVPKNPNTARTAFMVVHPFSIMNYADSRIVTATEGKVLYKHTQYCYPKTSNLVMVADTALDSYGEDEQHAWITSVDELETLSIPIYEEYGELTCPYIIHSLKRGFRETKLEEAFSIGGIPRDSIRDMIPVLGIFHEFFHVQDEYVRDRFMGSMLSILNDAKEFAVSDINESGKKELFKQTLCLMKRFRTSIANVSPYEYDKLTNVLDAVTAYNTLLEQEEREKMEEDSIRAKARQEQIRQQERDRLERQENFMKKIQSRMELLDQFDAV